jgi:hypothetical protein
VDRADGAYYAELHRSEESAGCHGVGGYHTDTTVVRVFNREGLKVLEVERSFTHVSSENHDDEYSGDTIEAVAFGEDGNSVVLGLSSGERLECALSPWRRATLA